MFSLIFFLILCIFSGGSGVLQAASPVYVELKFRRESWITEKSMNCIMPSTQESASEQSFAQNTKVPKYVLRLAGGEGKDAATEVKVEEKKVIERPPSCLPGSGLACFSNPFLACFLVPPGCRLWKFLMGSNILNPHVAGVRAIPAGVAGGGPARQPRARAHGVGHRRRR